VDAAMSIRPAREVALVFAVVTVLTLIASALGRLPPFDQYEHLAVAVLFLGAALHMSQRRADGVARYGLRLGGLLEPPEQPPQGLWGSVTDMAGAVRRALPFGLREAGVALLTGLVVFPGFALGFFVWHAPARPFVLIAPEQPASYALTQLLMVALPEEALFRGYIQSRLGEAFTGRTRLLGASLSLPAWLLQAALFALIHYAVDRDPARLAVFFPALLFGWLRALRGGIGAAAAFHALCNGFADVLVRGWL
jgi:membrane protease YdiL (CAAX protease family)